MNLVIFTHPPFSTSRSMNRVASMLADGLRKRGHTVETWSPKAYFSRISILGIHKRWFGYIDQYLIFPNWVRKSIKQYPADTLFVFMDNALGPWVPLVASRPHIVHCNDFLAQYSAQDTIKENPTSWTGKQYQALIRRGYRKGNYFVSISQKTRNDLHHFLGHSPKRSEVLYLGINEAFSLMEVDKARKSFTSQTGYTFIASGYLLHIGGNPWYKNRKGVIELYTAWRRISKLTLPLIMIGEKPIGDILASSDASPFRTDIHFLSGLNDETVCLAFAGASVFLFPSLAEGFGWPIAEAMACGCPVITTNEAPMTEVAGEAAFLIDRRPLEATAAEQWAVQGAKVINQVLSLSPQERSKVVGRGLRNVERFSATSYIDGIEQLYAEIINNSL